MNALETILVVDDDIKMTTILKEELTSVGYDTQVANDGAEALERLQNEFFELILLDLRMPNVNGIDVLKELNKRGYPGKVIVLTGYADVEDAMESRRLGATDFLSKPYDLDELLITIRKVLHSQ